MDTADRPPSPSEIPTVEVRRMNAPERGIGALQREYEQGFRGAMNEEMRLTLLHRQEARKILTCSDGRTTGYELKVNTNGFGTSLFLYLEQGDVHRTQTVFTELTEADGRAINEAFSRLPNTAQTADTLRMYIQKDAQAVLRWARINDGSPLTSIRLPEPPKPFDYEPYRDFTRSFTLSDGTVLQCKTNPEPTAWRVRFEFSVDGGKSSTVYPVDTLDSGRVLEALQALPDTPNVGEAIAKRMKERGLINALVRQELLPSQ